MLHLLQAHVSMHQYKASLPSCPHGIQMVSMPTAVANTDPSFNLSSTCRLHNDPMSHEGYGLQSVPCAGHWSCGAAAEAHHRPQSSSPPVNSSTAPSVNSGLRLGPCHGSGSTHLWTSPSLLDVNTGFQGGNPDHATHAGHENSENRPLSASPINISQSQPTLCLQPPSDEDEYSCLLSSVPTGVSTQSLLDSLPSSYPHLCLPSEPTVSLSPATQEDICVLMSAPASHHLIQDASIFQIKDSRPSILPLSPSPTLPHPLVGSSLDSASPRSDALEPHLPLGDPSAIEHTSLECLLGNGGSMESKDSESASSRRSSIGVQTQSTEQSWCLDLTD